MNDRVMHGSRHYLHWIAFGPISPDLSQISSSLGEKTMPIKQALMGQGSIIFTKQVHHQFRDSGFGWWNFTLIRLQSEMATDRALEAVAVEKLPLDFECLVGFLTDDADSDLIPIIFFYVSDTP